MTQQTMAPQNDRDGRDKNGCPIWPCTFENSPLINFIRDFKDDLFDGVASIKSLAKRLYSIGWYTELHNGIEMIIPCYNCLSYFDATVKTTIAYEEYNLCLNCVKFDADVKFPSKSNIKSFLATVEFLMQFIPEIEINNAKYKMMEHIIDTDTSIHLSMKLPSFNDMVSIMFDKSINRRQFFIDDTKNQMVYSLSIAIDDDDYGDEYKCYVNFQMEDLDGPHVSYNGSCTFIENENGWYLDGILDERYFGCSIVISDAINYIFVE
jgi:hypothetical protein